jgi:hypothetical protein
MASDRSIYETDDADSPRDMLLFAVRMLRFAMRDKANPYFITMFQDAVMKRKRKVRSLGLKARIDKAAYADIGVLQHE